MKRLLLVMVTIVVLTCGGSRIEAGWDAAGFTLFAQLIDTNEPLLSTSADSCIITVDNAPTVAPITTFTNHTSGAWNAVFSHTGDMLATCAQDGRVFIHDLNYPDSLIQFIGHTEWVLGLAFSPDDHFLASTGTDGFRGEQPGHIKIWDVTTGLQVRELPGHTNGSWCLDFQESTNLLASCGKDGLVKLWDPSSGSLFKTLTGHTGWVLSVDFHPNLDLVASSGIDRTIRLWDSQTGDQVDMLTGHTNNIGSVKFSPDGAYVASGADDGTVRLWNVADGTEIWNISAGQGWINGVNFSPSGELMLTCGHDGSVVLRRTQDGLEVVRLMEHTAPVLRGSFNASGTLFATASWDNTVRVWGICATGIENEDPGVRLPLTFTLSQNYPNPFNPTTTISFDIPGELGTKRHVTLTVRDLRGRYVKTLFDSEFEAGCHKVVWDGTDDRGLQVTSGVYLYTLRSLGMNYTKKMVLLR